MATITGDRVGYFGIFLWGEKFSLPLLSNVKIFLAGHDRKDAQERDHRQHVQRRGRQHTGPRRRPQVREGLRRRPGINVIKLFTAVIYDFSKNARAFILGNPFQSGLRTWGQGQSQPNWSTFPMLPSWASSWCYQQMLDKTGKWLPVMNTSLFGLVISDEGKKFYKIDTWCQFLQNFFLSRCWDSG